MESLYKEREKEIAAGKTGKVKKDVRTKHSPEARSPGFVYDVQMQSPFGQSVRTNDGGCHGQPGSPYHLGEAFPKGSAASKSPVLQRIIDCNSGGSSITHDEFQRRVLASGSQTLIDLFRAIDGSRKTIYYRDAESLTAFRATTMTLHIAKDVWGNVRGAAMLGHELQHAYDLIIGRNPMNNADREIETELNAWCSECIVAMEKAVNPEYIDDDSKKLIAGFRQCVLSRSYLDDPVEDTGNMFLSRLASYCRLYGYGGSTLPGADAFDRLNMYMHQEGNRDKVIAACWNVFEQFENIFHPN